MLYPGKAPTQAKIANYAYPRHYGIGLPRWWRGRGACTCCAPMHTLDLLRVVRQLLAQDTTAYVRVVEAYTRIDSGCNCGHMIWMLNWDLEN